MQCFASGSTRYCTAEKHMLLFTAVHAHIGVQLQSCCKGITQPLQPPYCILITSALSACCCSFTNLVAQQDDFKITKKLATGGFGTVYRAELDDGETPGGRPVIIKKVMHSHAKVMHLACTGCLHVHAEQMSHCFSSEGCPCNNHELVQPGRDGMHHF